MNPTIIDTPKWVWNFLIWLNWTRAEITLGLTKDGIERAFAALNAKRPNRLEIEMSQELDRLGLVKNVKGKIKLVEEET